MTYPTATRSRRRSAAAACLACLVTPQAIRSSDCNNNFVDDPDELSDGATPDCNFNGVPDDCDLFEIGFAQAMYEGLADAPQSAAVADVNGDGDLDLLVVSDRNSGSARLYLLHNRGDGTFAPAAQGQLAVTLPNQPRAIAVGDLDGNGMPDAVTANLAGSFSVVMNNGGLGQDDRWFGLQEAVHTSVGDPAHDVALVHLDGDGQLDLLIIRGWIGEAPGFLDAYLGQGDGTFVAAGSRQVGFTPRDVAVADLDGDGDPDFAIANQWSDDLSIVLNHGVVDDVWQGFAQEQRFCALIDKTRRPLPFSVCLCDVDDDGDVDVVLANGNYVGRIGDVAVLLNEGNDDEGNWIGLAAPLGYPVALTPGWVAASDGNHDGLDDLFVANFASDSVSVLLNLGTDASGTWLGYRDAFNVEVGSFPTFITAHDLFGDESEEVIVVNRARDAGGTFIGKPTLSVIEVGAPKSLDCDDDLVPDECEVDAQHVSFPPSQGPYPSLPHFRFTARAVAVGHFSGLTAMEIAVVYGNTLGLPLVVFPYDGEGAIGEAAFYSVPSSDFMDMVRADVDGDGDSDIVIGHDGGLSVAFNDGAGGFDEVETFVIKGEMFDITGGDLDADGDLDFVGALMFPPSVLPIFLNDGDGRSWTVSTSTLTKYEIEAVDLGDVNGDGLLDVIASEGDPIRVFLNNGRDGSSWLGLADSTEHSVQAYCTSMTVADLNADSFADIAVTCRSRDEIRVLLNRGCDGTGGWLGFSPPVVYPTVETFPDEIKVWDMDRDGDLDLVTLMLNNVVSVRANDGQGGFNGECDCLIEHDYPGCNDPACDAVVGGSCDYDRWDANCVREAMRECTSCNRHVWTRFQFGVVTMGVGDLTGDTMPDVVLVSGGVLSLLNTGAPPIGTDCNRNDQPDTCDLSNGSSLDENGDGRPDECTLEGDFNVDGVVDLGDLRRLLNCLTGPWIEAERTCSTRQDLTHDTKVDLADVAVFMTLLRH